MQGVITMAENTRRLPIGVQSFEKMRQGGYLYVDKTRYVYQLVHDAGQYFLSRPRRFGKSLFIVYPQGILGGQVGALRGSQYLRPRVCARGSLDAPPSLPPRPRRSRRRRRQSFMNVISNLFKRQD